MSDVHAINHFCHKYDRFEYVAVGYKTAQNMSIFEILEKERPEPSTIKNMPCFGDTDFRI